MVARRPAALTAAGLVVLALAVACTETDGVTRNIGVIQILPTARESGSPEIAGLRLQYSDNGGFASPLIHASRPLDADPGIQSALWTITRADLELEGAVIDLLIGGDSCVVQQTAVGVVQCRGRVIQPLDSEVTGTLTLRTSMELRRVEPPVLQPMDDFDGDTVPNSLDNCPLVSNEDQDEGRLRGHGAACTTDLPALDSDNDTVRDAIDNCVYFSNPFQGETLGSDPISDTIGDACPTQRADVKLDGETEFELTFEVPVFQAQRTAGYVVVDFGAPGTVDCDWVEGECTLVRAGVRACFGGFGRRAVGCD